MKENKNPWIPNRGIGRLVSQETNISDVIQELTDRDASPWLGLIGFVPENIGREAKGANNADLLVTSATNSAIIEVKLGHFLSEDQQAKYEKLPEKIQLFMAALQADSKRIVSLDARWQFISLGELIGCWTESQDEFARLLAERTVAVIHDWDEKISGVLAPSDSDERMPVEVLNHKFLARIVTRRMAEELIGMGLQAFAGTTSGGGLPLIQAWSPIRNGHLGQRFIAEVRWWESKPGGELRIGVDFKPETGEKESESLRRAAYALARSMEDDIDFGSLHAKLQIENSRLADLIYRTKPSRPKPKGDWELVLTHGFAGSALEGGRRNSRRQTNPGFYGDGALRFQAIASIDFSNASAGDLVELICMSLKHLRDSEPKIAAL